MTINFSNQYEVGFFSPPSGSTTTTSTCYTVSCSTTSTTSTTNVHSSKVKTFATDNFLSSDLARAEYNGVCSSRVVQSRARCRTPPAQSSVTCPGERGLTSGTAQAVGAVSVGVLQHQHAQLSQIKMELDQSTTMRKTETWPESFQDLRSWCHPDQDELHTPQITLQDEFNFSPDGPVNINCNWGYMQSPVELNEPMLNQDLLLASPNNVFVDEENNNYAVIDIQGNFTSYNESEMSKNSIGKVMDYNGPVVMVNPCTSALKTKSHDVLLSQAGRLDESPPIISGEPGIGGSFFDIKLNSSQTSSRLGSGGKLILKQEKRAEEFQVPLREIAPVVAVKQPQLPVVQQTPIPAQQSAKRSPQGKPRPKLKPLNIPQPSSNNTTSSTCNPSNSIATPDVLKSLTDISSNGFNLLQYVCGGEESRAQPATSEKESIVTLHDHDYADPVADENIFIKCEPMSPPSDEIGSSHGISITNRKRSHSIIEDEYYYDSDLDGGDSGSEDWIPDDKKAGGRQAKRGRKASSGAESFEGPDRYRALRDRNNEASRRSRQNRKQRDLEIRRHKTDLERKNAVLKVKADRMEHLVKEMRAALLQSVTNSRKKAHNQ